MQVNLILTIKKPPHKERLGYRNVCYGYELSEIEFHTDFSTPINDLVAIAIFTSSDSCDFTIDAQSFGSSIGYANLTGQFGLGVISSFTMNESRTALYIVTNLTRTTFIANVKIGGRNSSVLTIRI